MSTATAPEPRRSGPATSCGVSVSRMDGERVDFPETWDRNDDGIFCLICRRDRAAQAALESAPDDSPIEVRAKLRRAALIEFEVSRRPDHGDGAIAKACRSSVSAVAAARQRLNLPAPDKTCEEGAGLTRGAAPPRRGQSSESSGSRLAVSPGSRVKAAIISEPITRSSPWELRLTFPCGPAAIAGLSSTSSASTRCPVVASTRIGTSPSRSPRTCSSTSWNHEGGSAGGRS